MTTFGPGFVTATAASFVAVDRMHPVAVLVSPAGEVLDVVSWADRVERPDAAHWPNRRVTTTETGLLVQDLPEGPVVSVGERDGRVVVDIRSTGWPQDAVPRYRKLWGAGDKGLPSGTGWRFRSELSDRLFWSAAVELDAPPQRHRVRFPRPSTLLDSCSAGSRAAACVLRSDKRPWPFEAAVELHVLSHDRGAVSDTVVEAVAVDGLTWHPHREPAGLRVELAEYLRFSLGQYDAALAHGAEDVTLTVRGAGTATTVELAFSLAGLPGTRVVRADEPFDELGNPAGLRAMNVGLDEDLAAGVPARLWTPGAPVVRI